MLSLFKLSLPFISGQRIRKKTICEGFLHQFRNISISNKKYPFINTHNSNIERVRSKESSDSLGDVGTDFFFQFSFV